MNALIDKQGTVFECIGVQHKIVCRQYTGYSLHKFLANQGGLRVLQFKDCLVLEHYKPLTNKQRRIVNRVLKDNEIYEIITESNEKIVSFTRPIKRYRG